MIELIKEFVNEHIEEHPEGRIFTGDMCDLFMAKHNVPSMSRRLVQLDLSNWLETRGFKKKLVSIKGVKRQGFSGLRLKGLDRASANMHPQTEDMDKFLSERLTYGSKLSVPVAALVSNYTRNRTTSEGQLTMQSELNKKLRLRGVKKNMTSRPPSYVGVQLK